MLWSPGVAIAAMRNFNGTVSAAGAELLVGNAAVASINYLMSDINSGIGAVTDISDPSGTGGWTDLVSLVGGPLLVAPISATNQNRIAGIKFDRRESTLHLRLQVLIDGAVVGDLTVSHGVAQDEDSKVSVLPLAVGAGGAIPGFHPFYCETSFIIRAARVGTCAYNGGTVVYTAEMNYVNVVRG